MYTATIHMEYGSEDAGMAPPKAEIDVVYRGLDMEQLLLIEDSYIAQSMASLVQAGRDAIS